MANPRSSKFYFLKYALLALFIVDIVYTASITTTSVLDVFNLSKDNPNSSHEKDLIAQTIVIMIYVAWILGFVAIILEKQCFSVLMSMWGIARAVMAAYQMWATKEMGWWAGIGAFGLAEGIMFFLYSRQIGEEGGDGINLCCC